MLYFEDWDDEYEAEETQWRWSWWSLIAANLVWKIDGPDFKVVQNQYNLRWSVPKLMSLTHSLNDMAD